MYIVILITCANKKEARAIAGGLIKDKLAACVNILAGVESTFWWENKVERQEEVMLVVKSKKTKLARIIKKVKSLHSYSVPEIIALPIIAGDRHYLKWIDESLGS